MDSLLCGCNGFIVVVFWIFVICGRDFLNFLDGWFYDLLRYDIIFSDNYMMEMWISVI